MPIKSKNGKRTTGRKRRTYRRRYRKSKQGVPYGIPTTRRAFLRYVDENVLTSTVGALNSYVFRANGLFDPNYTGTGHQPMGFDTWNTLYNHYIVVGAKCQFRVTQNATGNAPPTAIGAFLTDSTTIPYTVYTSFMEAKRGTSKVMPADSTDTHYLTTKFSAKKFYNVKDVKDNLDRIGSQVTADPSDQALFVLYAQNMIGGTNSVRFQVIIDYIVDFSEPKDLPQS